MNIPKKAPTKAIKNPGKTVEGYEEIKVMPLSTMVAAFETDATRVFTYRLPTDTLIQLGFTLQCRWSQHESLSR